MEPSRIMDSGQRKGRDSGAGSVSFLLATFYTQAGALDRGCIPKEKPHSGLPDAS